TTRGPNRSSPCCAGRRGCGFSIWMAADRIRRAISSIRSTAACGGTFSRIASRGNLMADIVSTTRDVAVDWTTQYDYGRLVEEEIAEYVQVEVTEELHLGGIHAQHAWRYWFEYLAERVWK